MDSVYSYIFGNLLSNWIASNPSYRDKVFITTNPFLRKEDGLISPIYGNRPLVDKPSRITTEPVNGSNYRIGSIVRNGSLAPEYPVILNYELDLSSSSNRIKYQPK